ncbi:hypothetical protein BaRGS_00039579 [Batillaria attramentaria]|uniref:Uncharacterized protein n=1 Tax=Batillaria attramentaria TaxID=370345 RepID=A0ABD0J3F4_9CAEN
MGDHTDVTTRLQSDGQGRYNARVDSGTLGTGFPTCDLWPVATPALVMEAFGTTLFDSSCDCDRRHGERSDSTLNEGRHAQHVKTNGRLINGLTIAWCEV